MIIRAAESSDFEGVWGIFNEVIHAGDTYVFDETTNKEAFANLWFAPNLKTYVAVDSNTLLGTYIIKPNQPGRGSHIANCSYMVKNSFQNKGIGDALCRHSIETGKSLGYTGIQFNVVVSSNTRAIKLWEKNGFQIIGTTPKGFQHKTLGLVDTHMMFKSLTQ